MEFHLEFQCFSAIELTAYSKLEEGAFSKVCSSTVGMFPESSVVA